MVGRGEGVREGGEDESGDDLEFHDAHSELPGNGQLSLLASGCTYMHIMYVDVRVCVCVCVWEVFVGKGSMYHWCNTCGYCSITDYSTRQKKTFHVHVLYICMCAKRSVVLSSEWPICLWVFVPTTVRFWFGLIMYVVLLYACSA